MPGFLRNAVRVGWMVSILVPGVLAAQSEWAERAREQFEQAGEGFRKEGYELRGEIRSGSLKANAEEDRGSSSRPAGTTR